jgi:hypothetical protein
MTCALARVVFMDFTLHGVFTANSHLAVAVLMKFAARPQFCPVLWEATKQAVNLSVHQDGGCTSIRIPQILEAEANIAEISI